MLTSPVPVPSGSERLLAVLAHLSGVGGMPVLVPLVLFAGQRRKSTFVARHALLALAAQSAALVLAVAVFFVLEAYVRTLPPSSGDFGMGRFADLVVGLVVCLGPLLIVYLVVAVVCMVQAGRGRWFTSAGS